MSWLEQINSGRRKAPRRIIAYGVHGVGKSKWASKAPSPIFIPTEDGIGDIDCQSFPLCKSLAQFMEYLAELYTATHGYQTVVIDTADWLEAMIHSVVAAKHNVETIDKIKFQDGYKFSLPYWSEVLAGLDALRNERGMTVVLLAHSKVEKYNNPETDPYDRYSPKLNKLASEKLQEWADEVFFASWKVFTRTVGSGFTEKNKGVGTGQRVLYTTERPAHLAKNRLSLPDELPLDWDAYAQYLVA